MVHLQAPNPGACALAAAEGESVTCAQLKEEEPRDTICGIMTSVQMLMVRVGLARVKHASRKVRPRESLWREIGRN
jgi:hypothetical protein